MDQQGENGWGRLIFSDGKCCIGYWKDNKLVGNCRKFRNNGSTHEEGWYEKGVCTELFRKESEEYKYWEMKDSYFLKLSKAPNLKALKNLNARAIPKELEVDGIKYTKHQ